MESIGQTQPCCLSLIHICEGKGEKGYFTRIGAAWPTKNGNGFNIQLDAVPLSGRITLMLASEKAE